MARDIVPTTSNPPASSADVLNKISPAETLKEALQAIVECHYNYKKVVEYEATKRESIAAWRDTNIKKLDNQRHILETYLTHTFSERAYNINQLFARLDGAIEKDDIEQIKQYLGGIVEIAKHSPLAGMNELLAQFDDPSVEEIVL